MPRKVLEIDVCTADAGSRHHAAPRAVVSKGLTVSVDTNHLTRRNAEAKIRTGGNTNITDTRMTKENMRDPEYLPPMAQAIP